MATVGNDQFFGKFVLTNNGVLYENPVLQIGVKCEFTASVGTTLGKAGLGNWAWQLRWHASQSHCRLSDLLPCHVLGRVTIFFGNRGEAPMTNVASRVYAVGNLQALQVLSWCQDSRPWAIHEREYLRTDCHSRLCCVLQLDLSSLEDTIPAGVQVQQQLQVDCVSCFTDPPVLEVTLT